MNNHDLIYQQIFTSGNNCMLYGRPTFRPIRFGPNGFRLTTFCPTLFSSNPGFVQSTFVQDEKLWTKTRWKKTGLSGS